MSYRELRVLLNHLPQESWTQTILRDEMPLEQRQQAAGDVKHGPWARGDYLLAAVHDAVKHLEFVLARVNGNDWKPPSPLPRPGVDVSNVRAISPKAAAYLNNLRAPRGSARTSEQAN